MKLAFSTRNVSRTSFKGLCRLAAEAERASLHEPGLLGYRVAGVALRDPGVDERGLLGLSVRKQRVALVELAARAVQGVRGDLCRAGEHADGVGPPVPFLPS